MMACSSDEIHLLKCYSPQEIIDRLQNKSLHGNALKRVLSINTFFLFSWKFDKYRMIFFYILFSWRFDKYEEKYR